MVVWKYGDDVNTDMLFPGKYTYTCSTADEIKPHLLEDLDPLFAKQVKPGDSIVAGKNFGCGSSREQPVVGLRAVGISAVIAKSFARIFYRSAINQGLLLLEVPDAVDSIRQDSKLVVDVDHAALIVDGKRFVFPKLPAEILAIRDTGGLLEYTRNKLKQRKKH